MILGLGVDIIVGGVKLKTNRKIKGFFLCIVFVVDFILLTFIFIVCNLFLNIFFEFLSLIPVIFSFRI